jgi:hypothetical protein
VGGIATVAQAAALMRRAGIVLRYGPHKTLPLASMYAAVARAGEDEREAQRRATVLTYTLIARGEAIEIQCLAGRVALADAALIPALVALCRRGRAVADLPISDTARQVLAFVATEPGATAGQVRALLGVPPRTWPNPADDALAELMRFLVIDRGTTDVPKTGAAYLSKDGIPYRLVDEVHAAHVKAARKLKPERAADQLVTRVVAGLGTATRRALAKICEPCLTAVEVAAAVDRLVAAKALVPSVLAGKPAVAPA